MAVLPYRAVLDKSALPEGQKSAVREITGKYDLAAVSELTGVSESVLKELTETVAGSGQVLAVAGGNAVADLSAYNLQYAVMLYNYVAGNVNSLLTYGHENFKHRTDIRKIQALFDDAEAGNVGVLITNNVNPAYVFAGRAAAFDKIGFSAAISVSSDETTEKSALVLPSLHFIESWGDDRSRKGIFALQQPAMAPVPGYDAKQTAFRPARTDAEECAPTYKEYLKARWLKTAAENKQPADEAFWLTALQNGGMFLPSAPVNVNLSGDFSGKAAKDESPANPEGLKLSIANSVFHNASGQTGDKLWLLEIPHPMTQIVWDSWAEINADKAIELGINHGDEVEVSTAYGKAVLGAYVYHGVSKNAVVIPAGMGRKVLFPNYSQRRNMFLPFTSDNSKQLKYLKVGENAAELTGFNLNSTGTDLVLSGIDVQIKKTGKKAGFVSLDGQYRDDKEALIADSKANYGDRGQKDREIVRSATPEEVSTGNFEGGGHHLKPRNYTVDSRNQRDFYKPVPETVKESIFFKQPNDNPTYYDPV
ncbi:hypothetical protein CHS0354_018457 [Potamilus streckersoni]|uniref:Molybdopterin dinucleotide-binding domain-containing protein n=1 Tax=Potamilus streckersoni TaxID=2493646 RepID=A0AAE0TBT0_9BIVA|nr:hypothetical protein CHS0354_018457 [Potamilus streckersoni]